MRQRVSEWASTTLQSGRDLVRRHKPDYQILVYMIILMLLGLIIIYAIGPQRANVLNNAYGSDYTDSYFFIKQLASLVIAIGAFTAFAMIPYQWVIKHGMLLLGIGFAACIALFIAASLDLGIAQCTLGACRWFDLGPLGSLQPAEILKFGMLAYIAGFLGVKMQQGQANDVKGTLVPVAVMTGVALLFIAVIQRDLGTAISLTGIVLAMLFVSGVRWKIFAIIGAIVLVVGMIFIVSEPHRIERIMTFAQGDSTADGSGNDYHIERAKIAIGSGGFFGLGIGRSVESTGYLPEAINDSVFAVMGETFGFVGLVAVIVLFVALLMRILNVMDHLVDTRLKLLAAGVFGWLAVHVILNIAAMTGILPLTGITLPLLSFGGTSMLFIAAALGIVFQLSRYTSHSGRNIKESDENIGSRRGIGRTRHTRRSSL